MSPPPPGPSPGAPSLNVLLIEDNPGDARLFAEQLRESDVDTVLRHEETLADGRAAIQAAPPDVLVVDLGLPDSEGPSTVEAVAAVAPETPIVVLTAQNNLDAALRAQDAGATEYLHKGELTPTLAGRTLRWAHRQERMQDRLRQRDTWLRSLTENIGAGIFRVGPTGRVRHANRAPAHMLGTEHEHELLGQDLTTLAVYPPEQSQMFQGDGADGLEVTLQGREGDLKVGHLSAEATRDADGTVLYYDAVLTDITQRKQAEQELRVLSEAIEQAQEAVLITEGAPLDAPGPEIEYVNSAFEDMTGYTAEEAVGSTPRLLQGPDTDPDTLEDLRTALRAGEEWEGEAINYRKDGTRYVVQWNVSPVRGPEGTILHWVSLQRDVTEQRAQEKQLRRQKSLLQQSQRLAGSWEVDLASGTLSCTDEVYRICELSPEEDLSPKRALSLYPPNARSEAWAAFRRSIEEQSAHDLELPIVTAQGHRRWVRTVAAPVADEDGTVRKVTGAVQDITDQKEAEKALRRSRELYRSLFRESREAILVHDLEGRVRKANPQAQSLFGYDEPTLRGMCVADLHLPADADTADEKLASLRDGRSYRATARYERADGSVFWGEVSASLSSVEGRPVVRSLIRDVTERREAQQALQEREARLRGITNSIPGVVYQAYARPGPEYGFYFVGKHAEELLGISAAPDDFFERCLEAVPPGHREDLLDTIRTAVGENAPLRFEAPFERPSGEQIWLLGTATPHQRDDELVYNGVLLEITPRKRAEQALREERNRYRTLFESLPSPVVHCAVQEGATRVLDANEAFEETFGHGASALAGETLDAWGKPSEEDGESTHRQALAEGPRRIEVRRRSNDGPRDFQVHVAGRTPEADLPEVYAIYSDITERKRRERALQRERDLLDRIFEVSPVAIVLLDREGNFVRASDRTREVLGLEEQEITQRAFNDPAWEIATPDGTPIPEDELPFARVLATEEPLYDVEHTVTQPDGSRRLLSVSGAPLAGPKDQAEGAVFHIQDITERRDIEHRFQELFENAGLGIALVDESGAILEANPALESMLGFEAGGLRGKDFGAFSHPADRARDREKFQELAAGACDQYQLEQRYRRRNGDTFWAHLTVSRREVPDGVQVVGMVENIDARKRQKQQLRTAKKEAERMNRLKSAFLANMSHEIRTPLTSILGFAEAIGDVVREAEQASDLDLPVLTRFSGLIEKSGRRLMETLTSVLNLSKLQAGEMNLSLVPINLTAEVEETVSEFEPQAQASGVRLHVRAADDVCARADEGGLRIVLRNLLSNAIKYTEEGGDVWVRVRSADAGAVLVVEDTGIGMDQEKVTGFFEAFKQESQGLGREYEGTGLGLTVTREALDQMGGSIEVQTEKGTGSRFTVRLPGAAGTADGAARTGDGKDGSVA